MVSTDVAVWMLTFTTLATLSYLWRENPFSRWGEFTMIGFATGNTIVTLVQSLYNLTMGLPIHPLYIIPLVLGWLLLAVPLKWHAWLARYPVAILTGVGVGVAASRVADTQIIALVKQTVLVLPGKTSLSTFNNIFTVVIVVFTIVMFIFTHEPKTGPTATTYLLMRRFGRIMYILVAGAAYASYSISRLSNIFDIVRTILFTFLQLPTI